VSEPASGHASAKRKRLLLFDIDGTLVSTAHAGVQSLKAALATLYGINDGLDDIEVAGKTDRAIIRDIFGKHRIADSEKNRAAFADVYLHGLSAELPRREGRVLPGVLELLTRLQNRTHIVMGLLTGNLQRGARMKLEYFDLWKFFEFGAFADDHQDRNELGAFARQRAHEKHGHEFDAADIDVIGDTGHDVACGKAFGARTIAVVTGGWTQETLAAAHPDYLFRDLSKVDNVITTLDW